MLISREWAMANKNTLSIKPMREWALPYIKCAKLSADPFARNCSLADITNDLNPKTSAKYHMKAQDFLKQEFCKYADLIIYDPPYSLRQVKESYNNVGVGFTKKDSQNAIRWTLERNIISENQELGWVVLSFGWSSTCMGKNRGYKIESILIVSHGSARNDTLCVAERKILKVSR